MEKLHFGHCLVIAFLLQIGIATSAQESANEPSAFRRLDTLAIYVHQDPAGLYGMLNSSDIVVVGVIEGIANEYEFYGDDTELAERYRSLPASNPLRFAVKMTELRVNITDVIKDDVRKPLLSATTREKAGYGKPEIPASINLRKLSYSPENFGKQVMIFGYLNPDEKSYGVRSFDGELYLEDNTIAYYDPTIDSMVTPLYARGMEVLEFWNNLTFSMQNNR